MTFHRLTNKLGGNKVLGIKFASKCDTSLTSLIMLDVQDNNETLFDYCAFTLSF